MAVTLNASTSTGYIQTADTSGDLALQSNGTTQFTVSSTGAYGQLKLSTAVTASGSSVDFTNIPAWVKRITVMINGLSYAAAGQGFIRIGSGALETTGYTGNTTTNTSTPGFSVASLTSGFGVLNTSAAASTVNGLCILTLTTGNTWCFMQQSSRQADGVGNTGNGFIALSGALDRLSLVATTSTFDAGTINILYEG